MTDSRTDPADETSGAGYGNNAEEDLGTGGGAVTIGGEAMDEGTPGETDSPDSVDAPGGVAGGAGAIDEEGGRP
jgi:hypothetical protein